jgi:hypothetical protein|tara:strand:- start:332 stop:772 length:441 start_codon:yes stop_codon:yes gene_type:complete
MESGQRKIDVDDMMAIAYALDVSPLALLLPFTQAPSDVVRPAGIGREMEALTAWEWAVGAAPHFYNTGNRDYQEGIWSEFRSRSHPWWLSLDAKLNERLISELRRLPPMPAEVTDRPNPLYDEQVGTQEPEWYRQGDEDGERRAEA